MRSRLIPVVGIAALLALVACGGERRRAIDALPDGDVLMFDASMIASDGGRPSDLGPRDLGVDGPRMARDTCSVSADCDDGITCTLDVCASDGTCSRTRVDAMCAAGQACVATSPGSGCGSGMRCTGSPCDAVARCGCATGQACVYVDGSPACRLAGPVAEGGACSATARCASGLACLAPDGAPGACSPYCLTDTSCSGAGSLCEDSVPGHETELDYPVNICTRPCNPVDSTGCGAGSSCLLYRVGGMPGRVFTDCRPAGTGVQFAPCTGPYTCLPGYTCTDTLEGRGFRCLHNCRWDVFRADCPAGLACVYGGVPPTFIGAQEYGNCGTF